MAEKGERGMSGVWPEHLPVASVRFARPTLRLAACRAFYGEALGLPVLASWENHQGYDGVVFGLPDESVQLELTEHEDREPLPELTSEHQLVLYLPNQSALDSILARLADAGYTSAPTTNPYWSDRGAVAVPDPDGWMLILAPWVYR